MKKPRPYCWPPCLGCGGKSGGRRIFAGITVDEPQKMGAFSPGESSILSALLSQWSAARAGQKAVAPPFDE